MKLLPALATIYLLFRPESSAARYDVRVYGEKNALSLWTIYIV